MNDDNLDSHRLSITVEHNSSLIKRRPSTIMNVLRVLSGWLT